jgi:predicted negative regulator of RcsB-dependent stress response
VDDYLSEKEQWEAVKAGIKEYGGWIIAGIAIGGTLLGGYRWYQFHHDSVSTQASEKYASITQALGRGDRTQALVLLGELERDYSPSPYVDQGRLLSARMYVSDGELEKAVKDLQTVATSSKDAELSLIARLRLARVQIAQQHPDEALATLGAVTPGAFAPRYHEVRGDAYYAKGDKIQALKEYRMAKASDLTGVNDSEQLDLKITDLAGETTPLAGEAGAPATPATAK